MLDGAAVVDGIETLTQSSPTLLAELGLTATREPSEQTYPPESDALYLAPTSTTQSDRRNELVFIDSRVDLSSVEEIAAGRTFVISNDVDAFAYMAEITGSFEQVDAIHVISHGADGELLLGNETYTSNNLETYRSDLSALGSGLTESGDILFYACDLAATDDGREFIQKLSLITEADIAASVDQTGEAGDSDLEVSEGEVGAEEIDLGFLAESLALEYADLTTWSGAGDSSGIWSVAAGGRTVEQSVNTGDYAFFVSPDAFIDKTVQLTLKTTDNDDDDMGFVVGYQDSSNYLLFRWSDAGVQGVDGSNRSLELNVGGTRTALDSDNVRWSRGSTYQIKILYTQSAVKVEVDGQTIFSETGVFTEGKLGFFNYSQGGVTYGNVRIGDAVAAAVTPSPGDDAYGVTKNTALSKNVFDGILANDYDGNLDSFTIVTSSGEMAYDANVSQTHTLTYGSLEINGDGSFTYTPNADATGLDTFTYQLKDTDGTSSAATVTFNVMEANEAPTDIAASTATFTNISVDSVVANLSTTDANSDDSHDYIIVSQTVDGLFKVVGNQLKIQNASGLAHGTTYTVEVRTTDLRGLTYTETLDFTSTQEFTQIDLSRENLVTVSGFKDVGYPVEINGVGNTGSSIPFSTYAATDGDGEMGYVMSPKDGTSVSVSVPELTGQNTMYALLTNTFGDTGENINEYDVTVHFSDDTYVTFPSIAGQDTRNFNNSAFAGGINGNTTCWWTNYEGSGDTVYQRLDVRQFDLSAYADKTITGVSLETIVDADLNTREQAMLSGLTFSTGMLSDFSTIDSSGQTIAIAVTEDISKQLSASDFSERFDETLGNIKITRMPDHGTLSLDTTGNGVGDTSVTLNAELTASQQDQLIYAPDANYFGADSFSWAGQGSDSSWSNITTGIVVASVNDGAPVISVTASGNTHTEDGSATTLLSSVDSLSDVDSSYFVSAEISISTNFSFGDTLSFTDTTEIKGSYSSSTGVLTLTAVSPQTVSVAEWKAALASIQFVSGQGGQATREITWKVSDGIEYGSGVTSSLAVSHSDDARVFSLSSANPYALEFDGTDDYLVAGGSLLNDLTEFTVSFWVKPDSNSNLTGTGRQSLVGQNDAFEIFLEGNDLVFWNPRSNGDVDLDANLVAGEWTHLTITGNIADGLIRVVKNGDISNAISRSISSGSTFGASTDKFTIGGYVPTPISGGVITAFDGQIDEVSIWSKVLWDETIASITQTKFDGSETGLIGYWSFDEGTGTLASNSRVGGAASSDLSFASGAAPVWQGSTLDVKTTFTVNQDASVLAAPGVTLTDVDNNLTTTTIQITTGLTSGDVLAFVNDNSSMGNISAGYDSSTGTLTLTSSDASATTAEWKNALSVVTFSTTAVTGASGREITWVVSDGVTTDSTATSDVVVVYPPPGPILFDPGFVFSADERQAGVEIPHSDSYSVASFTAELWVKPDGILDKWQPLFMKTNQSGDTLERNFSLWIINNQLDVHATFNTTAGQVVIESDGSGYYASKSSGTATSLTANEWNHIAFSYDSTTWSIALYINGTTAWAGTVNERYRTPVTNNESLYIGGNPDGYSTLGAFNGDIADVRLYNTALASTAIQENRYQVVDGSETGLVFATRFATDANNKILDIASGQYKGVFFEGLTAGDAGNASDPGAYVQSQFLVRENSSISIGSSDITIGFLYEASVAGNEGAFTSIKVTSLPTHGDLTLGGVAVSADQEITLAAIDSLGLVYTPDAGYFGAETFQFRALDAADNQSGVVDFSLSVYEEIPFSLGTVPSSFTEGDDPVLVLPNVVLGNSFGGTGTKLNGLQLFIDNVSSGDTLSADSTDNITVSYNSSSGRLTLSGEATVAEYQELLRTVTFKNLNSSMAEGNRSIVLQAQEYVSLNFGGVSHYYEYVADATKDWDEALVAASNRTMVDQGGNTLTGYLVTVTSAQENAFINTKLAGNAWLGATDSASYNANASENNWVWATGMANEIGTVFWDQVAGTGVTDSNDLDNDDSTTDLTYGNWRSGEPNDNGTGEDVAHFYAGVGDWNDFPNGASVSGYVVEYHSAAAYTPIGGSYSLAVSTNNAPVLTVDTPSTAYDHVEGTSATQIIDGVSSVSDSDGTVHQVTATISAGEQTGDLLSFGDTSGKFTSTFSQGVLTISADTPASTTTADWDTALASVSFASGVAGSDSRTITWKAVDDRNKPSTGADSTIHVTIVNASPTIPDAFESLTATAIDEDVVNGSNGGQTVATLFADSFADIDEYSGGPEALAGIIIVADSSTAAQGTWQFDNGSSGWSDIGTVTQSSGLLLDSSTKLRFNPAQHYNGSPGALTAHVVDTDGSSSLTFSTSGSSLNREYFDVSASTSSDAVSADSATVSITVAAVQDDPTVVIAAGASEIKVNKAISVDFSSYSQEVDTDAFTYAVTDAPAGLAIDSSTGVLSGTVARAGEYTFTVTATSDGVSGPVDVTSTYVLTVKKPVIATSSPSANADISTPQTSMLPVGGGNGLGTSTLAPGQGVAGTVNVFNTTNTSAFTSNPAGLNSSPLNGNGIGGVGGSAAPGFNAATPVSQVANGSSGLGTNGAPSSFTARLAQVTGNAGSGLGGASGSVTGTPGVTGDTGFTNPSSITSPTIASTQAGTGQAGSLGSAPGSIGGANASNLPGSSIPGSVGGVQSPLGGATGTAVAGGGSTIAGSGVSSGSLGAPGSAIGGSDGAGNTSTGGGLNALAQRGAAQSNGTDGGSENLGLNAPPLGGVGGPSAAERGGDGDSDFAGFAGPGSSGLAGSTRTDSGSGGANGSLQTNGLAGGPGASAAQDGAATGGEGGIGSLAFAPQAGPGSAVNQAGAVAGPTSTSGDAGSAQSAVNGAPGTVTTGANASGGESGSADTAVSSGGVESTQGPDAASGEAQANAGSNQQVADGPGDSAPVEGVANAQITRGPVESVGEAGTAPSNAQITAQSGNPNASPGGDAQASGGDADAQTATAEQATAERSTESVIDPTTGVVDANVSNSLMKMGTTMTRQIDRVVVQVGADGQVSSSTLARNDAENPSGLQIVRVVQEGRSIEADLADNNNAQVQEYQAVLVAPDGSQQPLPDWIKIDAETGKLTGEPPAGVDSINLAIKAVDATGESRVMILNLNVSDGATEAPAGDNNVGSVESLKSHGTERFTEQLKRITRAVA